MTQPSECVSNQKIQTACLFGRDKRSKEQAVIDIRIGSRARGDFRRTSDIDLAVEGGDFVRFALDVDEETSTLLKFDIVDLGRNIQEELLESIRREGRILYEKE